MRQQTYLDWRSKCCMKHKGVFMWETKQVRYHLTAKSNKSHFSKQKNIVRMKTTNSIGKFRT
jgi:hypothetical protein